MNQEIRVQGIRFLILILVQVLILHQVNLGDEWLRFAEILIYPMFIMMMPMRWPSSLIILLAFLTGLIVDGFYDTPGVHAGASTLSAFARPLVLQIIAPRAGYDPKQPLTKSMFGMAWYASYAALFLLVHIFIVQLLTVFTFYYWTELLLRLALSWVLSLTLLILVDIIFNPKS
ncbi:MAG: hypothetical protein R2787_11590 [Saprospiraceae bacterium]|nr:hypothetical protein [Saprospiraceae bacterium]MCB9312885.1 hypothetical protein [Lewinellaceae bacterium]HRW74573.1 hypothetical protein [Saprospiraceae bacterium]